LAETLESFLCLVETNHASALNVERVHILVFAALLSFSNILQSTVDVAVTEAAPSQMLVHSHILVIQRQRCFERTLSLLEIFLFFVEQTNLDECVNFLLDAKQARENTVLEEFACLVNLVSLGEDGAKFVKHLGLLIKVGRHLQHANQSTYRVVIRLESFIKNTDAIPKLRIVHILNRVESMLVGSKGLVNVLSEEVAMAESCPRGSIVRVVGDQLAVVFDSLSVVATSRTELSHFAEAGNR